jgi:hypothetical protein
MLLNFIDYQLKNNNFRIKLDNNLGKIYKNGIKVYKLI